MKKKQSRFLVIFLAVIMVLSVPVVSDGSYAAESTPFILDGLEYTVLSTDGVSVTDITDEETRTNVIVPATVENGGNTYKVVSISKLAFYRGLDSPKIDNLDLSACTYLKEIGNDAFSAAISDNGTIDLSGCRQLDTIGERAFATRGTAKDNIKIDLSDCTGLTTIKESTFRDVGARSIDFSGCINLKTIEESACQTLRITNINFSGCTGLTTIEESAFTENGNTMTSLDLSDCTNLKVIDPYGFEGLIGLESLDLSGCEKLQTIGAMSFGSAANLESLDLSGCTSLETIGQEAFRSSQLNSIDFSGNKNLESIGERAFLNSNVRTLDFFSSVNLSFMGDGAFGSSSPNKIIFNSQVENVSFGGILAHGAEPVVWYPYSNEANYRKNALGYPNFIGGNVALDYRTFPVIDDTDSIINMSHGEKLAGYKPNGRVIWGFNNNEVPGTWKWADKEKMPALGESTQAAIFTPYDTGLLPMKGTIDVNVKPKAAELIPDRAVVFDPNSVMMNTNTARYLSAYVLPYNATHTDFVWLSSNNNIARVDQNGRVTAGNSEGTAVITAISYSGKSATCKVKVVKPVTKIRTPKSTVYMKKKTSYTLPVVIDSGSKAISAKLSYSSSNKKVATVSSKGKIKTKKSGTAKITIKANNGKKKVITVKVRNTNKYIKKLYVKKVPKSMKVGKRVYISVKSKPYTATNLRPKFTSSKKSVATVDKAGKITAKKPGKVKITIKSGNKKVVKTIRVR